MYIEQTKRSINTRIKEHKANCRLGHTEKSTIADHSLNNQNHPIRFQDTQVLAQAPHYHTRFYIETMKIHKHKKKTEIKIRHFNSVTIN